MKRGFAKAFHKLRLKDGDILVVDRRATSMQQIMQMLRISGRKVNVLFVQPQPGKSVKQMFHVRRT